MYITCPHCKGVGEELVLGSDVERIPDEWWPCRLCGGAGTVPVTVAFLYEHDEAMLTRCDECGYERICVDDGVTHVCAECWPVSVPAAQEAAT